MPALRQKLFEATRRPRAFLSLEMNPAHPERTQVSESSSGTEDDCTGFRSTVWTFGSVRSEATWLFRRMEDLENRTALHEPYIGEPFGWLYYKWVREKHSETEQFFATRYKNTLLNEFCSAMCGQGRL